MKFLVLAACLAVSSAQGFFGLQAHPNGAVTPIDEPRVAAARADHLASHGFGHGVGYAHGAYAASYPYAAAYPYAQSFFGLQAHPNGAITPVNEPAVAAARADHFAALGHAYHADPALAVHAVAPIAHAVAPVVHATHAVAPVVHAAPVAYHHGYAGPLAGVLPLVSHPNGAIVPADEPAVAAARADHLSHHGGVYGGVYAGLGAVAYGSGYGYAGPLAGVLPLVSHPNGAVVPADEPAVAAARAAHLSHHGGVYGGVYAGHVGPVAYGAGYGYAPYAGLIAHPNGAVVPVDTPAVAAARAEHLAHHG